MKKFYADTLDGIEQTIIRLEMEKGAMAFSEEQQHIAAVTELIGEILCIGTEDERIAAHQYQLRLWSIRNKVGPQVAETGYAGVLQQIKRKLIQLIKKAKEEHTPDMGRLLHDQILSVEFDLINILSTGTPDDVDEAARYLIVLYDLLPPGYFNINDKNFIHLFKARFKSALNGARDTGVTYTFFKRA